MQNADRFHFLVSSSFLKSAAMSERLFQQDTHENNVISKLNYDKSMELRRLKIPCSRTLQIGQKVQWEKSEKKKFCIAQIFHGLFHLGESSDFSPESPPYRQHFGLGLHMPSALPTFPSHELLRLNQLSLLPRPSKYSSPPSFRKATLSTIQSNCCLIPLYVWVLVRFHLVATDISISSPFNIPLVPFK